MSTQVYVAGVGSTKFGVLPGRTLQSLAVEAGRAALRDSNIAPARIGCVFVGNFVGGIMTGQELLGPIVANFGLSPSPKGNAVVHRRDLKSYLMRALDFMSPGESVSPVPAEAATTGTRQ